MAGGLLTRQRQIAVKAEAVEGTAVTLGATAATMRTYDESYTSSVELFKRKPSRATLSPLKGIAGKRTAVVAWLAEFKGSGALATRPSWDVALRASGFTSAAVSAVTCSTPSATFQPGETVTGSSSGATGRIVGEQTGVNVRFVVVTATFNTDDTLTGGTSTVTCSVANAPRVGSNGFEYRPHDGDPISATVGYYLDGTRRLIFGARANVSLEANVGEPMFLNFSFEGVYQNATDLALLSPTYETTVPKAFLGVGLTVQDFTTCFTTLTVDMQNTLAQREDANNANGLKSVLISDREPMVTLNPEFTLVADYDIFGKLTAETTGRIYADVGSTAGEQVTFAGLNAQHQNPSEGDRGGIATLDTPLDLVTTETSSGGDEVQIAMI